jgi:hypothetical protein
MIKKEFKQKESKTTEVCPGLAHRTIRCATGQCPVHHPTVSGAPGNSTLNSLPSGKWRPLRYNSPDRPVYALDSVRWHTRLSGVSAEQRLLRAQRSTATHLMRACARRGQSTRSRCTGQSTGFIRCTTGQPDDPTCQSSNGRTLTAG